MAQGAVVASIQAHASEVYCIAWSPDGTRIATGGNDTTIRLWNAETYELMLELRGHDLYVKAIAFSPDGSMIVSGSGDTSVRVWDSVEPHVRYAQALERRRVEREVRAEVDQWMRELESVESVADRIRAHWSESTERRLAALRVLALAQRDKRREAWIAQRLA